MSLVKADFPINILRNVKSPTANALKLLPDITIFSCNSERPDWISKALCYCPSSSIIRPACCLSISPRVDLSCKICYRHHKLSHQFTTIGCGIWWLIWFWQKCTWLCFFFPIGCWGELQTLSEAIYLTGPCASQGLLLFLPKEEWKTRPQVVVVVEEITQLLNCL